MGGPHPSAFVMLRHRTDVVDQAIEEWHGPDMVENIDSFSLGTPSTISGNHGQQDHNVNEIITLGEILRCLRGEAFRGCARSRGSACPRSIPR